MKSRPAETGGAASGVALLIAHLLGVNDADLLATLAVIVGLIPAAVTLLVANGGIRGVLRKLWAGRA